MCIILYKEAGVELPTKDVLERCWAKNKDGAGFIIRQDGWLRVRKGFMSFKDFWAGYKGEGLGEEDEFAIHFRYATAGGVSKGYCHPFPLEKCVIKLTKIKYKKSDGLKQAMMHNGVLGEGKDGLSDTMVFVLEELYYMREILGDKNVVEYIEGKTKGSKLLIFDEERVIKTGEWIKDAETGIYYSNRDYVKTDWRSLWKPSGKREVSGFGWGSFYRGGKGVWSKGRYQCENCGVVYYTLTGEEQYKSCINCGHVFDTKCKTCGAMVGENDYLVFDRVEKLYYCLSCDKYLGEGGKVDLCELCGVDNTPLIEYIEVGEDEKVEVTYCCEVCNKDILDGSLCTSCWGYGGGRCEDCMEEG